MCSYTGLPYEAANATQQNHCYVCFKMKILAWNVQGAKKHQIREEIRFLQTFQQPDLMFVIETMASEATSKQIIP